MSSISEFQFFLEFKLFCLILALRDLRPHSQSTGKSSITANDASRLSQSTESINVYNTVLLFFYS